MAKVIPKRIKDIVKQEHVVLSKFDRDVLVERLSLARQYYENQILQRREVRVAIYNMFNERYSKGLSLAYMSRFFNMSRPGINTQSSQTIRKNLFKALEADKLCNPKIAMDCLKKAELRHIVLYHPDIIKLLHELDEKLALTYLNNIHQIHDILFKNMFRLVARSAKTCCAHLAGDVITYEDAFNQGIIAAKEGVHNFKPKLVDNGEYNGYMQKLITAEISKFIAENTRVVSLPRNHRTIDRYGPVKEALEELGYADFATVALLANQKNHDRKLKSRGRKLQRSELYTEDEVAKLVSYFQPILSLDNETSPHPGETPQALGDRVPNNQLLQDELYDKVHNTDVLFNVLSEYCGDTMEFQVIVIRWGLLSGTRIGLNDTAIAFTKETGVRMNKGKVKLIEERVFERIRQGAAGGDQRLRIIMDRYDELNRG